MAFLKDTPVGKKCIICGESYHRQSDYEPAEPCWCGQMASGSLWGWDGFQAYRNWIKFRTSSFLLNLGWWLVGPE